MRLIDFSIFKIKINKTESKFSPRSRANAFYSNHQFFFISFQILNWKIQYAQNHFFFYIKKYNTHEISLFLQRAKNKSISNHSRLIRIKNPYCIIFSSLNTIFQFWRKFWHKFGSKNKNNNNKVILKITYALHARDQ